MDRVTVTFGVRMQDRSGAGRWSKRRHFVRRGTGTTYRRLQSLKFLLTRDRGAVRRFLSRDLALRLAMLRDFYHVTHHVRGYHTLAELLTVTEEILARRRPVVVEAGAGFGGSTAKLSLATRAVGGRLHVFDSFQGIPDNDEAHHLLDGRPLKFRRGAFRGRLAAVKKRVAEYGAPEVCTYTKGLFADTLPGFSARIDVALLDVDLISSTRTCVTRLFPLLAPDGVMFSQDGHLRETVELLSAPDFWRDAVGVAPPRIEGLHRGKLITIRPAR